ncbi:GIY-YIG nuclease family protein [Microbulbifer agarilyticus]|uniref:GIY-YIG nuclease family protein n=1 Tax=Microbulbifer agarilyticus TaxID=260552 RepID=UPI001CD71ED7|nr:GIY-YIG nuclease family protein [Microbulbifer agarilyticus]MCA0902224.1 GIY-YIG nuclease family protein [Microbulbifer agarilyticus]
MHTVIYVMRHIDIGGHIDIPYKKVGITGAGNATLSSRLQQISNTKSPIKAQYVAAWEHQDARAVETALHMLLEDSRIEGEWFLDKDDTLVERMQPIMELIGANELVIEESDDEYTRSILKRESEEREKTDHILLAEIANLLDMPLRSSSRIAGPTFFSDGKQLTYYVNARKSGKHHLSIGRSKAVFGEIRDFLESRGYDVEQGKKGGARVLGISKNMIAEVINSIEAEFEPEPA